MRFFKRRVLPMLLAIVLVLSFVPAAALAVSEGTDDSGSDVVANVDAVQDAELTVETQDGLQGEADSDAGTVSAIAPSEAVIEGNDANKASVDDPQTVVLKIFHNGDTENVYKTVYLPNINKGDVLDLTALDISEYYTSAYGCEFEGYFNDGSWNQYKANGTATALDSITINGWTNLYCMVTDLQPVVVHAVTSGDKDGAETIFNGKAPVGTELISFLDANVTIPEKTGYTSDGWYNWDWYGHKFDETKTVTGWTNVYVTYTANDYTLSFDANGGTVDPVTKTVTYDAAVGELPVPVYAGHTFNGWYTADGTLVTADTVYTVADNSTLTAKWDANSYNLTLNYGEQSGRASETRTVVFGSAIGTLPGMETTYRYSPKKGYTYTYFVGSWNTKADGTGDTYTAETLYEIDGDLTLYAQWIPDPISGGQTSTELFTIQCDTDDTHAWVHNTANVKAVADTLRCEDGVWKVTVSFNRFNDCNSTVTRKNYFGNHTHYHPNGDALSTTKTVTFDLCYDPTQSGTTYAGTDYVGKWVSVGGAEANVFHVKCYTAPVAPKNATQIASTLSGKMLYLRDLNSTKNWKPTSKEIKVAPYADTLEIGEVYQEDGKFYVKVTVKDLQPYVDYFNEKNGGGYQIVWEENHNTADDFTYVLTYKTSSGAIDYKQDGTGWTLDTTKTTYKDKSEKLNGKILYLADGYHVVYTDGLNGKVFAKQDIKIPFANKGIPTPAFTGNVNRPGYTFLGWDPQLETTVTKSITYTAQWDPIVYTLTLDPNGGNIKGNTGLKVMEVKAGDKLSPSSFKPTRTGYKFGGWADKNGDIIISAGSMLMTWNRTENLYLTAVWTANEYTVSFNSNGGETLDSMKVTFDSVYGNLPSAGDVVGLQGLGWYLMDSSKNVTDTKIEDTTIVSEARNHTLFQKREIMTPTVTITSDRNPTYYTGESVTLTANVAENSVLSYTYQWYKDGVAIDGATEKTLVLAGNVSDTGSYTVTVTAKIAESSTIVTTNESASATSAAKKITIRKIANTLYYKSNGGEGGPSSDFTNGTSITVRGDKPTRTGYTFVGWNTAADGSGKAYKAGDVYEFADETGNGGIKAYLYAQWQINTYEVTFNFNDGVTENQTVIADYGTLISTLLPELKNVDGYTSLGWYAGEKLVGADSMLTLTGDCTLVLKREIKAPTVTITSDRNPTYYTGEGVTLTANVADNSTLSYTYQWYKDGVAIEGATEKTLVLAGNVSDTGSYTVTVIAKTAEGSTIAATNESASTTSVAKKITIRKIANTLYYKANGGEGGPSNSFTNGTSIAVRGDQPTRDGYTFIGWNTAEDGSGKAYKAGDVYEFIDESGNGGIKAYLYAQWTPNTTPLDPINAAYKVEHYLQQLDGTYVLAETEFPLFAELGTTVDAQAKTFEHYVFDETNENNVLSGEVILVPTEGEPEILTLKVYYKLESVTVTIDLGDGKSETVVVPYGTKVADVLAQIEQPTREGYTFAGWVDANGDPVDNSAIIVGNSKLSAAWTAIPVTPATGDGMNFMLLTTLMVCAAAAFVLLIANKKRFTR